MSKDGDYASDSFWNFSLRKSLVYSFIILVIILFLLIAASFLISFNRINSARSITLCGDGSFSETCSVNKPYYCNSENQLIRNSDLCGCSENFSKINGICYNDYAYSPKEVTLNYILDGKEESFSFVVYGGLNDYLTSRDQSIKYHGSEIYSRADFKLDKINEPTQRNFLMPLVAEIQNLDPDKDDQARIAISIVQNIPYGESDRKYSFVNQEISYSRYPYQVLYDNEGICGEKTELLSFLLRELGYGVSFFYYSEENHEALGIKCPVYGSLSNTGYCFVETTAPSIISDHKINYVDVGGLHSEPNLFFISDGLVFGEDGFYELHDARKLNQIEDFIERYGWIGPLRKNVYEKLQMKYKLAEEYYGR